MIMRNTVNFSGTTFPPSFGYLEAADVCGQINIENPTWVVELQFNGTSNFSFSFFNVTYDELKEAAITKLNALQGPKQLPAFAFPQRPIIQINK